MNLPQCGEQNMESVQDGGREECVPSDSDVKCAIPSLFKTMSRITMRCEDGDLMPPVLQAHGSVDDETLGSSNAEVGMDEDYVIFLVWL